MKQKLVTLSFIVISFTVPVLLHAQTLEFRMDSTGTMGGNQGYFLFCSSNDTLYETDFMFEESGYVRWYAFEESYQSGFTSLPGGTYQVKIDSLRIGDSWTSWIGEPTTAVVADTETITVPAGTFFAYVINHYLNSIPDSITGKMYLVKNVGWVRIIVRGGGVDLASYSIAGGSGYFPLAVGNYWNFESTPTGIKEQMKAISFSLNQNFPNPFNPTTVISYQLSVNSHVTLKVYDVLGREVETLVNERESAGKYSVKFDRTNLPSGVYFYRIQAGTFTETKKLMVLK